MTRVFHLAETDSTNAQAMARAVAGEPLPFWVSAERQTAGKGRSGREWVSDAGNLHASLALRLNCDQKRASQLSLVAGVALINALGALSAGQSAAKIDQIRLKWPNDIVVGADGNSAKLGGILIETTCDFGCGGLICVIGFGLNVVSCPTVERKVTHLAELGFRVTQGLVHAALAASIESALTLWAEGENFAAIRARWLEVGMPVGSSIRVHAGDTIAEGQFGGLDNDGALLMKDLSGRIVRFTFGDVTL